MNPLVTTTKKTCLIHLVGWYMFGNSKCMNRLINPLWRKESRTRVMSYYGSTRLSFLTPPLSVFPGRVLRLHLRREGGPVRLVAVPEQRDLLRGRRALQLRLQRRLHGAHLCPAGWLLRPEPLRSRHLPQRGHQLQMPLWPRLVPATAANPSIAQPPRLLTLLLHLRKCWSSGCVYLLTLSDLHSSMTHCLFRLTLGRVSKIPFSGAVHHHCRKIRKYK